MKIKSVKAREILDSRGIPTIESEVYLENGSLGVASIPSGSTIERISEFELRDNDPTRFTGLGVLKAVDYINNLIAPRLKGLDASYQKKIDSLLLDINGSATKKKLGCNTLLAVSQAVLEAAAASYNLPIFLYLQKKYKLTSLKNEFPQPIFTLISGGNHGDGNLDFQEFQVIISSRFKFKDALIMAEKIYQNLKNNLKNKGVSTAVSDDGGFTPKLFSNLDALEIITETVKNSLLELRRDAFLGLDCRADFFYKNKNYLLKDRLQFFNKEEMINYYLDLINQFNLLYLEDPLIKDDWKGWQLLAEKISSRCLLSADYFTQSQKEIIKKALQKKICKGFLIKLDQIGTISEAVEIIYYIKKGGGKIVISQRIGETSDDFLADFAVGTGADFTKFGAPARGERISKYNRLLKISEQLESMFKI